MPHNCNQLPDIYGVLSLNVLSNTEDKHQTEIIGFFERYTLYSLTIYTVYCAVQTALW